MQDSNNSPGRRQNLFGREHEITRCWELLATDHLLIPAPRRVGKTSLMKALKAEAGNQNFRAIYITVEGKTDEDDFIDALYREVIANLPSDKAIKTMAVDAVGNQMGRIKKLLFVTLEKSPKRGWRHTGERLQKILEDDSCRWLLLMDELPVFLSTLMRNNKDGTERARQLLDWLRALRNPNFDHIRWVFCGSIGLDSMTERHKMTTSINDLKRFSLPPFPPETARLFLTSLSDTFKVPLSEPAVNRMLERCGWLIPYHLQLLFDALRNEWDSRSNTTSLLLPEQVDAAFETLLTPGSRSYFIHWKDRLIEELGQVEGNHALFLLNLAAIPSAGESREILTQAMAGRVADAEKREEQLDALLTLLERDGYLVEEGGRHRFRSPLLREFWLRHVAKRTKR